MVDFHYNSANEWTTIQRYVDLTGSQQVATGTYGYDETGRLTDLDYSFPAGSPSEAQQYEWAWDEGLADLWHPADFILEVCWPTG